MLSSILNFLLCFVFHTQLSFSNTILLYLFITAHFGCETDADCPRSTDKIFFLRCINKKCEWAAKRHWFSEYQIKENAKTPHRGEWVINVIETNVHYMLCSNITSGVIFFIFLMCIIFYFYFSKLMNLAFLVLYSNIIVRQQRVLIILSNSFLIL